MPTSGERLCHGCTKFDFTVDEGEGRLNPSLDKKLRQAPQKTMEKEEKKSCVAFLLLCDPDWCVSDVQNKWDDNTHDLRLVFHPVPYGWRGPFFSIERKDVRV